MAKAPEKVLVHACCAACTSYLLIELEKLGLESAVTFYNPQLNHLEYHYLLTGIEGLCEKKSIKLVPDNYDSGVYLNLIAPYTDKRSIKYISDPERYARKNREITISLIMEHTAQLAKEKKYPLFTTAMLASPYRDHNTIWDMGQKLGEGKTPEFFYKDFRKGYWTGRNFARNNELAIPEYCSDYLE